MIPNRYKDAYKEVYTILEYLDKDDYNKIPPEVINAIKSNMNEEYDYEMNEEVDIFKQPMLPETKATLFNLFRDYLSTPVQKEKIIKMQEEDRRKNEIKKQEQYKYDDLFKSKNIPSKSEIPEQGVEKSIAVVHKEKWYNKIFNTIKGFLNKDIK